MRRHARQVLQTLPLLFTLSSEALTEGVVAQVLVRAAHGCCYAAATPLLQLLLLLLLLPPPPPPPPCLGCVCTAAGFTCVSNDTRC